MISCITRKVSSGNGLGFILFLFTYAVSMQSFNNTFPDPSTLFSLKNFLSKVFLLKEIKTLYVDLWQKMDNWRGDMTPLGMPHHNISFEQSVCEELSKTLSFMTR